VYSVSSVVSFPVLSNPRARSGNHRKHRIHKKEKYHARIYSWERNARVVGACFEVYKEKGCGFLEAVFQECLELELTDRHIPFRIQPALLLQYKGRLLKQTYQPDFVCYDEIILEIKAVSNLNDEHRAQVRNYLRASGLRVALLVNCGHHPLVQHERIVR